LKTTVMIEHDIPIITVVFNNKAPNRAVPSRAPCY